MPNDRQVWRGAAWYYAATMNSVPTAGDTLQTGEEVTLFDKHVPQN
jgi:hypothetical protein